MNLALEKEFSKAPVLKEINQLKAQVDNLRLLPADLEGRVMQKLRLEWNYNSNAIEGNKLNYGETVAFLMTGITAKGKPLKDYLDIKGHNEAINFLISIVKETRELSETDIRALHKMILVEPYEVDALTTDGKPTRKTINIGEYKTQSNHVQTATGEIHYYATPEETPIKMRELMEWYQAANQNKEIHPIVTAALFHHRFVEIHPFDDGNGRLSRILMNLVLMQSGYPPAIIKMDDRQSYYALLSQADTGDSWPFVKYIIEREKSSLELYIKAANGGDIDEDEDIDKEILLLKMELKDGITVEEKKSRKIINAVFLTELFPLSLNIKEKMCSLNHFFFESEYWFRFINKNGTKEYEKVKNENIEKCSQLLLNENKDCNNVELELEFKEYRNPEKNFDIVVTLQFLFETYHYKILLNNNLVSSRLYHQELSSKSKSEIIKKVLGDFKERLSHKLQ